MKVYRNMSDAYFACSKCGKKIFEGRDAKEKAKNELQQLYVRGHCPYCGYDILSELQSFVAGDLSRRRGRFRIPLFIIKDARYRVALQKLFGSVIVVGAEPTYATNSIQYVALSHLFSEVGDDCEAPEYQIVIGDRGGDPHAVGVTKL